MLIDFYIVVHSINLINFFEETKKYKDLINYKYLLVGKHETDYSSDSIIQCDRLPDNIEDKNYYLAYTGWYALARNININSNYICLLEYDTDIMEDFNLNNFKDYIKNTNSECYGLTCGDIKSDIFNRTQFTDKMLDYLKSIDIREIKPNTTKWITTNNIICKPEFFKTYINDSLILGFLEYLDNHIMSGHFLERVLTVYCFLKQITFNIFEQSGLQHRGLDSHKTQNIHSSHRGYEQFKVTNKISD